MPTLIPLRRVLFYLLLAAACPPIIILLFQTMKTGVNFDHGYSDVIRSTFDGLVIYGVASEVAWTSRDAGEFRFGLVNLPPPH